jgi:sensor histidine kinase YesM
MIVMGGFILLLITTGILLFRNYRLLHIQKQLLLEQRLLRSQMNPHFIFNALASIQGFMFKKDIQKAGRYLSNFSKLIRNILENSREDNVTLENEIGTVTNYLELQKLRYGDKFDFEVEVDENLDPEEILVPPMLAQPFIENAVEHGIKYKEGQGHIKVRFGKNGENVVFEVEDDGVGRQKAKEIAISKGKKHKSLATKITNERIQSLSKKLRRKINIAIIDLEDDEKNPTGTRVVFELPIVN